MGVNKGADTLYHATQLTRADIGVIIRGIWEQRREADEPGFNMEKPTIDGDSNNICHVTARKSEIKSVTVADFFKQWASCGIKVVPIVDGDVRPTCKQATNDRIAERDKDRIQAFLLLKEVNKLKRDIAQGLVGCDDLPSINETITKLEAKSRNKLAQSEVLMPSDFAEALEEALVNDVDARAVNNSGGFVASVLKAKFQADAAIIGRFLTKETLLALTNDSDIPIVAGDDFIAIKEYSKDGRMTLVSTSRDTLVNALSFLGDESSNRVQLKDAVCPIFENVKSRKLRALMMVALGCDVYKSGINGAGPKTLRKILDKLKDTIERTNAELDREETIFKALLEHTATVTKLGIKTVDTLVKGIIFEPTNYAAYDCQDSIIPAAEHTYFDGLSPAELPTYLSDFAATGNTIIDTNGPIVMDCTGVGDRSHLFLQSFGSRTCFSCNRICCCSCSQILNDKSYCLQCFAAEAMVPSRDGDYMSRISEMRTALTERFNYPGAKELSITDVEEVYDCCVLSVINHEKLVGNVTYPIYPSSEIENPSQWSKIYTLQFRDGGSFVTSPDLTEHLPAALELFSSFVKYEKKKHTSWVEDPSVYDSLPAMIINIAQHSRVDTGYRLLERCVRHGHDPKMPSLFCNCADIVKLDDGSLGLVIKTKVPASMKDQVYETCIVITAKDMLATECSCRSGSKDGDRVVCVHNLPVAYKVTELLYDGLAEHILLELASCINTISERWSNERISSVKDSVIILMDAAGESLTCEEKTNITLDKLLDQFLTGTEKVKAWGQRSSISKHSKQGPIDMLCFESPAKKARNLKDRNKTRRKKSICADDRDIIESLEDGEVNDMDQKFTPHYLRVSLLMAAVGKGVGGNQIGFRLNALRSDSQKNEMELNAIMKLKDDMDKGWQKLKELAQHRTIRFRSNDNLKPRKKAPAGKQPPSKKQRGSYKQRLRSSDVTPPLKSKTASSSKSQGAPQNNQTSIRLKKKQGKKKRLTKMPHTYCAKEGCTVNNLNSPSTKFHRIPAFPKKLPAGAHRQRYIERQGIILLRQEISDRCGFKRGMKGGAYRICEEHDFVRVTKPAELTWGKDKNGKRIKWTQSYDLYVPCGEGASSTMCLKTENSRGIGTDRQALKTLEVVNHQIRKGSRSPLVVAVPNSDKENCSPLTTVGQPEYATALAADAAEARKAIQQMAEVGDTDKSFIPINPSVAHAAGISVDTRLSPPVQTPGKNFFNYSINPSSRIKPKQFAADKPPIVVPGVADSEVKRRTGFPTEGAMLSYIFLVCNGDIELVQQRRTSLTWYEEWFFHFEYKWGRTLTRWIDATATMGLHRRYLLEITEDKVKLERRARRSWPMFASYQEDRCLRKEKWNSKYGEANHGGVKRRPIFWDMTGIRAYQFGAADTNCHTYSKYYSGNVFKGGIFTQCCGWAGTYHLWGGNVSDTEYNKSAGYLQEQELYQQNDLVDGELVPFLNIYDKGYRARDVCRRHGQLTAQPAFCKSDKRFTGSNTLYSASIASDRGGNERAVLVSKRSGVIKRGFKAGMDVKRFQDTWLTWGFQSNFMFDPVL